MKDPAEDGPEERPLMPQSVESVDGGVQEHIMPSYLTDAVDMETGSVDDAGDERYKRLSQNVPDGYVTALQIDLRSLGYDKEVGEVDGAFGNATAKAVKAFQRDARIEDHGVVDHSTRAALAEWLAQDRTRLYRPDERNPVPAPMPAAPPEPAPVTRPTKPGDWTG